MKFGLSDDIYEKIKKIADKFNIVNEFDMIDMVYTMDIVFIEDITKKEFLDSILKEGINL